MKRRSFLRRVATGAASAAPVVVSGVAVAAPDKGEAAIGGRLVTTPAVIMAPREDGVEIVWGVSALCHGRVEWQGGGDMGVAASDGSGFVPQGDSFLRVRIRGWKPGTVYELRTITGTEDGRREEGPWRKVRTLDSSAASTRFVVWNDTHENAVTLEKLHAVTPAADFLIWNGDTCNNWTREDQLIPTLLSPAGQDISASRPLFLTYGNHDVRGRWAFRMPGLIPSPSGKPYYAFRSGPVAVICLHTGEDKPDDHPSFGGRAAFQQLRTEQARWLAEVVARPGFRDAPYRVVMCHIPLRWTDEGPQDYAKGGFDRYSRASRDLWHDLLVTWKAQVVLSGHTHHPRWLEPAEGFPYAQVTGGGPQPERATWMEIQADAAAMVLKMSALDGAVVMERTFAPVSA